MATGRIGTTPALGYRWSIEPAGGTTSLSGLDANSVGLTYTPGNERVYRNGVLLSRVNDYTATSGNSITLIDATIAGDIIEVFSQDLTQLADTIAKSQLTAKGQILTATAASTPATLAVGTNDHVLTADSATATGLKWAAVPAVNQSFTLLNSGSTTLPGAVSTVTISGISAINQLQILFDGVSSSNAFANLRMRFNGDTGSNYDHYGTRFEPSGTYNIVDWSRENTTSATEIALARLSGDAGTTISGGLAMFGCNSTNKKPFIFNAAGNPGSSSGQIIRSNHGIYHGTSTISSVTLFLSTGNFDGGSIFIYGSA